MNKQLASSSSVLSSPAWLLRGISSIPGELTLKASQITFVATDRGSAWDWQLAKLGRVAGTPDFMDCIERGDSAVLFSESLSDVRVRSPWYYFSGGLILTIRAQSYRLSFGRPAGSSINDDELQTVHTMRQAGKRWLKALASQ